MEEKIDPSLNFYSFHDFPKHTKFSDYEKVIKNEKQIHFPCLILIRDNGWNDYGFYSQFYTYYMGKNNDFIYLGTIKIIQLDAIEGYTILPTNFESLQKGLFFSRGTNHFYTELKSLGELRNKVLSSLNDIHFNHYSREYIEDLGNDMLSSAYRNSLFREDFYDLNLSSEYAKNTLDVLNKINRCVDSLSELEKSNQMIIRRLLYGSVITALESYLGDAFKYNVISNKNYFYSFLTNYDFPKGDKKYNLAELGLQGDKIGEFVENRVKEIMDNIIFHNVKVVMGLYKQILNVDLSNALIGFKEAIQKRHDIFHRNGKNLAGVDLEIEPHDIYRLITDVKKFISETERILGAQI